MVRYLQQLRGDIEHSIKMALELPELEWVSGHDQEEEDPELVQERTLKLSDIYDIPYEAFPPDQLLTEEQVTDLQTDIQSLWSSWRLWSDFPVQLSARQRYAAMLHAMKNELVTWNPIHGGSIKICHFEVGSYCPFGKNGEYCYCKELDATVKHDLAIWEEHVRSQGLDPYRELTEEESAAFEDEMRQRNKRKAKGDDILNLGLFDLNTKERSDGQDRHIPFDNDEEIDWIDNFFWEAGNESSPNDHNSQDYQSGDNTNHSSRGSTDDDEFDLPFF